MSKLIVFEGIDGTGKGSQIKRAVEYLRNMVSPELVQTKDPGGTKLGACIREIMYEKVTTHELMPGVVDLLFFASHLQNWLQVVLPALTEGKLVVTDRWWYSQAAYMTQRFVPFPIAKAYMDGHGRSADLLIFLHGDAHTMVERARAREDETHQTAKAWNDAFILNKIQDEYIRQFSQLPEWVAICVDGKSLDDVWTEVRHILKTRIVDHGPYPVELPQTGSRGA